MSKFFHASGVTLNTDAIAKVDWHQDGSQLTGASVYLFGMTEKKSDGFISGTVRLSQKDAEKLWNVLHADINLEGSKKSIFDYSQE